MSNDPVTAVLCGDLNLLRCFTGTSISALVVGLDPHDLVFYSRYCRHRALMSCPRTQPQQAVQDLVDLARRLPGRPVLFYGDEPTLLLVSRHRETLSQFYRLALASPSLVEDLTNKVRFAALAQRLNLPVPRTLVSSQASSAHEALKQLSLPCIFKPITHVGWYASEVVQQQGHKPFKALPAHDAVQFHELWQKMSRYAPDGFVVQEYIAGADDCIYSFHSYLDRGGTPLAPFVGRKLRTYPKCTGFSTCLQLVHEPSLVELGLEILARMQLVGPVKLDFKRDLPSGRFYLLEANPRLNLWSHLGTACGINLPRIAYNDLWGQRAPRTAISSYRTNVRWLSFGNDLRAFLRDYHRDGDLSWAQWLRTLCVRKVYDTFCWRDPLPWVVGTCRYVREFARVHLWRHFRARRRPVPQLRDGRPHPEATCEAKPAPEPQGFKASTSAP